MYFVGTTQQPAPSPPPGPRAARTTARKMKLAYLSNIYPKVSHTFIRREILELERRGHEVLRLSIRPCGEELVDPLDTAELPRTLSVLGQSPLRLILSTLVVLLSRPRAFAAALGIALQMHRVSDRGLLRHAAYVVEACFLLRALREHEVEHVHVHFATNAGSVMRLVRRLGGPPYSMTVHGPTIFDGPIAHSLGEKVQDAAFVVAISSFCSAQVRRWVPYEHWSKIHVVRCGLDEDYFGPTTPLDPGANTLLCVGRLTAAKGPMLLVDALKQVVDEGHDVRLVMAGDGEMRSVVEQHIRACGLGDRVRITGWIGSDQVREHLKQCRALVLPSFAEGLPTVIMEAMAMGRPVVSTNIAAIAELVEPGVNGWLVPAGSVRKVAEAVREVMETPVERLNAMGEAGRRSVEQQHRTRTVMDQLESLLAGSAGDEPLAISH